MKLSYTPDGAEAQRWDIQLGKLRCHETEAIERRTGMAYGGEFKEKLLQGQVLARRALLWTMMRRTHHTIRFEDVDFADAELVLEFDVDEWQRMVDEVDADASLEDDVKAERLRLLRAELAKAEKALQDAEEASFDAAAGDLGKAPDSGSATGTGWASPS